jgi:hypothetical protein
MLSQRLTKPFAITIAAVAVGIGGYTIASSSSGNGASGTANAAALSQPNQSPNPDHNSNNQRIVGQVPANWHSGSGTIITGAVADKAKAVALAKYPGGTVNRVLQLSDGSYAVHMIKISWPHHVFVNTSFTVTGAIG